MYLYKYYSNHSNLTLFDCYDCYDFAYICISIWGIVLFFDIFTYNYISVYNHLIIMDFIDTIITNFSFLIYVCIISFTNLNKFQIKPSNDSTNNPYTWAMI